MLQFHVVFVFPFLQLDLILVLVEGLKSKKKKKIKVCNNRSSREKTENTAPETSHQ